MTKKRQTGKKVPVSVEVLRARLQRALDEGRSQHALELAKQLYHDDPQPAHRQLLEQSYLSRGRQLRREGRTRDAAIVLQQVVPLAAENPSLLEAVATELAAAGDLPGALALAERLPDPQARARLYRPVVDAAVAGGPGARDRLPETLREAFDRIRTAFDQVQAGQDDAARETLQPVGLQSPFLEWKVFLRGLIAYYQRDDARAIENWQRLDPQRLPAQLAAPLRFQVDADFRRVQPPETQSRLQKVVDRLGDAGLIASLRLFQSDMTDPDALPKCLRAASHVLPSLKQQDPTLAARLSTCLYWHVANHGMPEDVGRFERIVGAPPDDPKLSRLRALVTEGMAEFDRAQKYWKEFEATIATNAAEWPAGQADRARSLVWLRMGRNAARIPDADAVAHLPPFFRDHPARPKPLKPGAEECLRRSIELAPDRLEGLEELFEFYQRIGKDQEAERTARQIVQYFPEHVPTLRSLAMLHRARGEHAAALELLQRGLRAAPLDRQLQAAAGMERLLLARSLVGEKRFDEARAEFRTVLAAPDQRDRVAVLCKWAAAEFKAGDAVRAEELLAEARQADAEPLALAYHLLIEAIRLKLPKPLKTRFEKDFNEALKQEPTPQAVAAAAQIMAVHTLAEVAYTGQRGHEKKVIDLLKKAKHLPFTEDQLKAICAALAAVKSVRLQREYAVLGQRRFPEHPFFYLIEADSYVGQGPYGASAWKVPSLLEQAEVAAKDMPPGDAQQEMLDLIHARRQTLGLGGALQDLMDDYFDDPDGDDWDDDYSEEDDWDDDGF